MMKPWTTHERNEQGGDVLGGLTNLERRDELRQCNQQEVQVEEKFKLFV